MTKARFLTAAKRSLYVASTCLINLDLFASSRHTANAVASVAGPAQKHKSGERTREGLAKSPEAHLFDPSPLPLDRERLGPPIPACPAECKLAHGKRLSVHLLHFARAPSPLSERASEDGKPVEAARCARHALVECLARSPAVQRLFQRSRRCGLLPEVLRPQREVALDSIELVTPARERASSEPDIMSAQEERARVAHEPMLERLARQIACSGIREQLAIVREQLCIDKRLASALLSRRLM